MQPEEGGYHRHEEADIPEGRRYAFRLDGGPERPDPCSLWQPEGVHGPSAVVRPDRFAWTDGGWKGVRREDLVFYELHVGTFTPEGTFDGDHPPAARPPRAGRHGRRDHAGRPVPGHAQLGLRRRAPLRGAGQLRRPARACNGWSTPATPTDSRSSSTSSTTTSARRGTTSASSAVTSPTGTRRPGAPRSTTTAHGCDAVRDYVLDNVRMWLEEFHFDGLRLDAVHADLRPGRAAHPAGDRGGRPRTSARAGAGRRSSSPRAT